MDTQWSFYGQCDTDLAVGLGHARQHAMTDFPQVRLLAQSQRGKARTCKHAP